MSLSSRPALALLAFALHVPGLRLVAGRRVSRSVLVVNVVAVAFTAVAAIGTYVATGDSWAALRAWLAGHFAWSCALAGLVLAGAA